MSADRRSSKPLGYLAADEGGAGGKRGKLLLGEGAIERRHAAICAGVKPLRRHKAQRVLDRRGDLLGRLCLIARDIDRADQDVLAMEERQQFDRHMRMGAFERDLVDMARRERREDALVLPPFTPERRLPFDIGRDAVTVADMDCGLAGGSADRAVQCLDTQTRDLAEIYVEGRFVELADNNYDDDME